jgi:tetratricopeptide (TPR) repeat protein
MNGKQKPSEKYSLRTLLLAGVLAIVASATVAYKFGRMNGSEADISGVQPAATPSSPAFPTEQVKTLHLITKPGTVVLPSEKAMIARAAIKRGDYAAAQQISSETLSRSKLQYWRFYPFNIFIDEISYGIDAQFLDNLNKWLESDKTSAAAYLIRSGYYHNLAWNIRGHSYSSNVPESKSELFGKYIELATVDALKAIQIDSENPFSYFMLLRVYAARGNTATMDNAFHRAIEKFPDYYPLYRVRLDTLAEKWGGSLQALHEFTDKYAGGAPEDSPLRLLYVHLYGMMLDTASSSCDSYYGTYREKCVSAVMDTIVDSKLIDKVNSAFDLYHKTDRNQFSLALWPIMKGIVKTAGAGHFFGVILQSAASHMDSQIQLVDNNPGKNNYMLDAVAANYWYIENNAENAERKWREALMDVENTTFSDETDRFEAIADIYDGLTSLYNKSAQYAQVIAYQNAVAGIRGRANVGYGHLKCHAYFRLKQFDEAVRACTDQIQNGSDTETYYWRAMAYKGLRQTDAELQDLFMVADSQNFHFRTSAALEISVIYGDRKDMAAELAALNSYPFLFDEKTQTKTDLAIAYNNRCFAQMQLGRFREALDDCTASLKYDNLPDAYQKYQQLTKRLAPSEQKSQ